MTVSLSSRAKTGRFNSYSFEATSFVGVLAAESRDLHHFHIVIENRLAGANRHVLNPAALVLLHQFHQGALSRTQVLNPPRRLKP